MKNPESGDTLASVGVCALAFTTALHHTLVLALAGSLTNKQCF